MSLQSLLMIEEPTENWYMGLGADFKEWNIKKGYKLYHCIECLRWFGCSGSLPTFICIFCGVKQRAGVNDG